MNTIDISSLIEALASPDTARGTTLTDMQAHAWSNPEAEMGVVVSLTGRVEMYDLTADTEPTLVYSARLAEIL